MKSLHWVEKRTTWQLIAIKSFTKVLTSKIVKLQKTRTQKKRKGSNSGTFEGQSI